MSNNDEIAGQVVKEYSEAKVALARSERELASVAEEYQKAASVLHSHMGNSFISAEQVIQEMNPFRVGNETKLRVSDGDRLMALLREHEGTRKRVAEAHVKLKNLGFGNID